MNPGNQIKDDDFEKKSNKGNSKKNFNSKEIYKSKGKQKDSNVEKTMHENRFGSFINQENEEEDAPTSDNTSSISDFSFGKGKWTQKKINDVFAKIDKEQNIK